VRCGRGTGCGSLGGAATIRYNNTTRQLSLVDLLLLADAAMLIGQFSSAFSLVALELSAARKGYVPPYIGLDGPYWPLVS